MIDFTSKLSGVMDRKDDWAALFPSLSLQFRNYIDAQIDYDAGVENWASYIRDGDTFLYICSRYPIAVSCSNLKHLFTPKSVEFVQLSSFREAVLSCERDVISLAFGDEAVSRLSAIKKDYYSFEEIWWATVT